MNNKKVVIIGGSAGAEIAAEIFSTQYAEISFIETYSPRVDSKNILVGKIKDGIDFLRDFDYFIATGDNYQRKEHFDFIYNAIQKNPVNCIHPSAIISPSAVLGYGNLICPGSIIHTNAVVKNNTIINSGAIVEHDCTIENYAQISPNVTLCGRVKVEEFSFIGAGSVVIPKIVIGYDSIVAAGSSVICDVEHSSMYAGVPAKYKKKIK